VLRVTSNNFIQQDRLTGQEISHLMRNLQFVT